MNLEAYHEQLISTAIANINEQCGFIKKAVDMLPSQHLWYSRNDINNSVGVQLMHLSGNIEQYINAGLGDKVDRRNRDNEFISKPHLSKEEVLQTFDKTIESALSTISKITVDEVAEMHSIQGFELNTIEVVLHVSHHLAYHCGQIIHIVKNILNQQVDLYAGYDLNLKNQAK